MCEWAVEGPLSCLGSAEKRRPFLGSCRRRGGKRSSVVSGFVDFGQKQEPIS